MAVMDDIISGESCSMRSLEMYTEQIERCQEVLTRLNRLPKDMKLPPEIRSFIKSYVSFEGMEDLTMRDVGEAAAKVLKYLKAIILKVSAIVANAFKFVFDANYRRQRECLQLNKNLLIYSKDPDVVKVYENMSCVIIPRKDIMESITATIAINDMIRFAATASDDALAERALKNFADMCKIRVVGNTFEDELQTVSAKKFNTFVEAGWSLQELQEVIVKQIYLISLMEKTKDAKKAIDKDIKTIMADIGNCMTVGTDSSARMINEMQKVVAHKARMGKFITSALSVSFNRAEAIMSLIKAIVTEIENIYKDPRRKATK